MICARFPTPKQIHYADEGSSRHLTLWALELELGRPQEEKLETSTVNS